MLSLSHSSFSISLAKTSIAIISKTFPNRTTGSLSRHSRYYSTANNFPFRSSAPRGQVVQSQDSYMDSLIADTPKPEAVAQLKALQEIINGQPMEAWDTLWKQGITPWDGGEVTPFVKDLISSGLLDSKRVFVPGCGSGYDVMAMTAAASAVVGLDISQKAVDRAIQLRDASADPKVKSAEFVCTNFFTYAPVQPFDVIFDYTFFCAIDPEMRVQWAQKMADLLSPQGQLITIIFPIGNYAGGPPYALSPKAYEDVLLPLQFEVTRLEPNTNSFPTRQGKEMIAYWTRKQPKSVM